MDKYEQFKEWFKKTGLTVYKLQSMKSEGPYGNNSIEFISLDSDRMFDEFETEYNITKTKEETIKIIDEELQPFILNDFTAEEIYNKLKENGLLK